MRGIKFIKAGVASLLIAAGAFVAVATLDPSGTASAAKCSTNDVIDCGVTSIKQLRDRYNSDYTKGTKAIYSYFGLTSDMVNKATYKQGTLYRDGRVVVDGKTVATGAHTVGRNHQAGSTKHTSGGYTFYSGPAEVRFVRDVRPVFVFFDANGRYTGAVMLDCGNPVVKAKPVEPPVAECTSLTASRVAARSFKLDAKARVAHGATISSYTYTISPTGGGNPLYSRTVATTSQSSSITTGDIAALERGKSYLARVTVKTSLGDKTNANCTKTVTTEAEKMVKVCDPKTNKIITVKESEAHKYLPEGAKECKPVAACVSLTAINAGKRSFKLDAVASANYGATISGYTFTITPVSGGNALFTQTVTTTAKSASVTTGELNALAYNTAYVARVTVKTSLGDKTNDNCTKQIKTEAEKMVKVCDPKTNKIIEVKESEAGKYLPVDAKECQPAAECVSLKAIRVGDRSFKLDAEARAQYGATISSYTFTIRSTSGGNAHFTRTVNATGTTASVTTGEITGLAHDTTYQAQVTVKTSVGDKTNANCTEEIKTAPEKKVKVCDPKTNKIIEVKESEKDKYLPVDAKECKPVAECVSLDAARIGIRSFKLDAVASADYGATISSYVFTISPVSGGSALYTQTVATTAKTASVTTGEVAALERGKTYRAQVVVKTSVGDKTNVNCTVTIKTQPEKDVKVCDPATGNIITVKESEASKYLPVDAKECQPEEKKVAVCDPATGEIIEVVESKQDDYLPVDSEKCKVEVCDPETGKVITVDKSKESEYLPADHKDCQPKEDDVDVCDPETGKIITVKESERDNYLPMDSDECKEDEPVVESEITELPKTGFANALTGVLGLGALTTAGYYYLASRRQ